MVKPIFLFYLLAQFFLGIVIPITFIAFPTNKSNKHLKIERESFVEVILTLNFSK